MFFRDWHTQSSSTPKISSLGSQEKSEPFFILIYTDSGTGGICWKFVERDQKGGLNFHEKGGKEWGGDWGFLSGLGAESMCLYPKVPNLLFVGNEAKAKM